MSDARLSAERMARPADYDAIADPYHYPGTTVLRDVPNLRTVTAPAGIEAVSTAQGEEP
jgi:hypothetical protein